jgi:hypothetical protein
MPIFYAPLDLSGTELRNARTQNLAIAPSAPEPGLRYYDTVLNSELYWNGTRWVSLTDSGGVTSVDGLTGAVILDDKYVDVTGDTMTGPLVCAPAVETNSVTALSVQTATTSATPGLVIGVRVKAQADVGENGQCFGLMVDSPVGPPETGLIYRSVGLTISPQQQWNVEPGRGWGVWQRGAEDLNLFEGLIQAHSGIRFGNEGTPSWTTGATSPEDVVVASIGSLYSRTDGNPDGTIYYKAAGNDDAVGWVSVGAGGGEITWPLQRIGGDAQVILMAGDVIGGTEPDAAFTMIGPGGVNFGRNGIPLNMTNEGTSSTFRIYGQVSVGAYDDARWLGGTNGTPALNSAMNDGFKQGDWAVDYGGSIWINTAVTGDTPSWVEVGAGGAVESVDGRTGVVTLDDKYVDTTGDIMTGQLQIEYVSPSGSSITPLVLRPTSDSGFVLGADIYPQSTAESGATVIGLNVNVQVDGPGGSATGVSVNGTGAMGGGQLASSIGIDIWHQQQDWVAPGMGVAIWTHGADDLNIFEGVVEARRGVRLGDLSAPSWEAGSGSPEGVVAAPVGSLYSRIDGAAGTAVYRKEMGDSTTTAGWVALASGGGVPDDSSITSAKIVDGTIVNIDIAADAAIDLSKLATDPLARANHTGTQVAATISDFNVAVRLNRLDQMALPTATINANGQLITGVATPVGATDAVNKTYVDNVAAGLDFKSSVRVAATTAVNLAAPGAAIDGVTLSAGNRVLLTAQSTASQNGIYVWNGAAAAATRASDADASAEVTSGLYVFVEEGTANGSKAFVLSTPDPITLGTTALTFSLFSGGGVSVVGTANRITVTGPQIDIAANYAGQTSITTLGTVTSGTWNGTPVPVAYGGTGATTAAQARINLGIGTGSVDSVDGRTGAVVLSDLYVDTAGDNMTGNLGFGVPSPTAKVELAAATTAAGGISFGGDVTLYRSAANVLRTDDDFQSAARIEASLSATTGGFRQGASGPVWVAGSGTPEGVVTAPIGSLFSRTNGAANTAIYKKETGTGNTGWTAVTGGVTSVDGRTGAVVLSDLYVDIAGDTMTGQLHTPVLSTGAAPAQQGAIRLTNGDGIWSRNNSATGDLRLLQLTAANVVQLGVTGTSGVGVSNSSKTLWVSFDTNATNAAGGITFGASSDTNLYRSAADQLKTDDSLYVGANFAIGTGPNASSRADIVHSSSHTSGFGSVALRATNAWTSTVNATSTVTGGVSALQCTLGPGATLTNAATDAIVALNGLLTISGDGAYAATANAVMGKIVKAGAGTLSEARSFLAFAPDATAGGTISVATGLDIEAHKGTNVTTGYGIYQRGAADYNYFNGSVGLGVTVPTARLHFVSATAAAGGILFGADVNLYRSATDVLRTDDAFAALTVNPTGLTGATQVSRYVGATASGAPTTGTFAVGDWVVDRSGTIHICTVAGTPGTWAGPGGAGGAVASVDGRTGTVVLSDLYVDTTGDTMTGKLIVAPTDTTYSTGRIGMEVTETINAPLGENTVGVIGLQAKALAQSTGNLAAAEGLRGFHAVAEVSGTGDITQFMAMSAQLRTLNAGAAISNGYGLKVESSYSSPAGNPISSCYGISISNQGRTGVSQAYGLEVMAQSGASGINGGVRIGASSGTVPRTLWLGYNTAEAGAAGGIVWGSSAAVNLYHNSGTLVTDNAFQCDSITAVTSGTIDRLTATWTSTATAWNQSLSPLTVRNLSNTASNLVQIAFQGTASSNDSAGIAAKLTNHTSAYGELLFYGRSAAGWFTRMRIPETGGLDVYGNADAVVASVSNTGAIGGLTVSPTGLTGATQVSRYVGATASGAPASGTFAVGDWVVDRAGTIRICTVAGTPGTWVNAATGITPSTGWLASGHTTDKSFVATSTTVNELANVLATLIEALKTSGVLAA